MAFKLVAILLIVGTKYINAAEQHGQESVENATEENLSDIYYKGLKITEPRGFCKQNICLTKCCPFGAEYHVKNTTCINTTEVFDPPIYDKYLRLQSSNVSDLFYFKTGVVQCKGMVRFQISQFASQLYQEFYLRTDGNLYVEIPHDIPPWFITNPENSCIDNFVDNEGIRKLDALVCFVEDEKEPNNYVLTATCMLISCVFILLTVGVYTWLPKLHNVHGRVLVVYLTCLFVGFLLMATMQLLLYYENATKQVCASMTFIIYFSLLSAFFWLNVMCYDIWRVFSGKREIRPQKLLVWAQIRAYAIYAFGVPTILTILLISLEYSGLPRHPWLPMVQLQGCFLSGNTRLLYLYGPMFFLCLANMVLFVLTTVKIAVTRKENASVLSSRESSRNDQQNDKQTLLLYVKLFILMGISWILEVVSALYPSKNWVYTDVYNVLIGLIIFVIFVCKRQIIHLLKERIKEKFQQYRKKDLRNTIEINSLKHRESQETIRSNTVPVWDIDKRPNVTIAK